MLYRCIQKLLFGLEAEKAHSIALNSLNWLAALRLNFLFKQPKARPIELLGLKFNNPVGLAAGLDKDAKYLSGLNMLGFGFIEIGSIPPKPQPGNPKPRLFRLTPHEALINRFGFNSEGMAAALLRLKKHKFNGVLGVSITQNNATPYEDSVKDYVACFNQVYPYADFISVNVSCPNVTIERSFQEVEHLSELVSALKTAQKQQQASCKKYVPMLVKLPPDMDETHLQHVVHVLKKFHVDGVISCNTSKQRTAVESHALAKQVGGLSGAPIFSKSLSQIKLLRQMLGAEFPIIAVGGITSKENAEKMFAAGANLVQIYTGLIYHGPKLIRQICELKAR
ncbi:MAG: quinone-dependent dihydroorotate dehydrogenase [Pseudomonadota bacterium]